MRQHKVLVGIVAALGMLVGGAYAVLKPPMLTSTALVLLPQSAQSAQAVASANGGPNPYTATQEVVADSDQVLSGALPDVRPVMSLDELRRVVNVGSLTAYVISISARGKVAADAEATANAVAHSYVSYVSSAQNPALNVSAHLLQPATSAAGSAPLEQLIIDALVGAVFGAVIGAIAAIAIGRNDRRLRERDEIADSIGLPVLASVSVSHPSDAAGWTKLLAEYEPPAVDAWRMRKVLRQLGSAEVTLTDPGPGSGTSLAVLSLSSDRKALALGPQLAVFAASLGIPTTLVVGHQQDANAVATLRAACAGEPQLERSRNLRVTVSDHDTTELPGAALTVAVAVIDGETPRVADTMRTTATMLGVSAGAASAEQLARVAVSAASDGRDIAGILVADADPTDRTTGRQPRLARPELRRMPTRMTGPATEIKR